MGFFSDLKEDLSQAVNDLKPDDTGFDELVDAEEGADEDIEEQAEDSSLMEELLHGEQEEKIRIPEELGAEGDSSMDMEELQRLIDNVDPENVDPENVDPENVEESMDMGMQTNDLAEEEVVIPEESMEVPAASSLTSENYVEDESLSFEERARALFGAKQEEELELAADEVQTPEFNADNEVNQEYSTADTMEQEVEPMVEAVEEVSNEESQAVESADGEVEKEMTSELETLLDQMDEQPAGDAVEESTAPAEENTGSKADAAEETAIITSGMKVKGDITSDSSMDVVGEIEGNIDILGKLTVTGTITGNSKAFEVYADGAKITGEVRSEGSVKIGQSSVVIGNIFATNAVIAGAVKGDIDVHGPVILDTSAIVMGNIKSKSVQINNGAVIEGMCSQTYADVNPTSFFDALKKESKSSKK